jgi:beta-phosphoglucomutase-like phosphatase (HAD superfamily)
MNYYNLFIFDLDDTLVMTEQLHYKCWVETLQTIIPKFEIDFETYCIKFHPIQENGIQTFLKDELGIEDWKLVISKKNDLYSEKIQDPSNTSLNKGVKEFIDNIIFLKKQFVIVSNSQFKNIEILLKIYPVLQKSSKIYYQEMFQRKKPNPECYIQVINDFPNLKKIGFEDSLTGIHAITQVREIDTIFVNSRQYIHYEYIIKTYNIKNSVKDFKELHLHI